jgi:predicted deacylase
MVGKKVLFEYDETDYGRANMELAEALGWEVLCTSVGYAGTSTAVAKEHGIPSIVPECGGADRTTAVHLDAIQSIVDGVLNVCRHLEMLDGAVTRPERFVRCDVNEHVHAGRDGMIRYEREFDLGLEVKKGQRIGALLDMYGDEVGELTSEWDGIITLVRRYPFVQTGDWICSVTLPAKV